MSASQQDDSRKPIEESLRQIRAEKEGAGSRKKKSRKKKSTRLSDKSSSHFDSNKVTAYSTAIIKIDGIWCLADFATLFESFEKLCFIVYTFINFKKVNQRARPIMKLLLGRILIQTLESRKNSTLNDYIFLPPLDDVASKDIHDAIMYFKSKNPEIEMQYRSLVVKRVSFGSPGQIEIFGLRGILSELVELIKHYIPNKHERIKNTLNEKEIDAKHNENIHKEKMNLYEEEMAKLKLLNEHLALLKSVGATEEDINRIKEIEIKLISNIFTQISKKQITDIELDIGQDNLII